MPALDQLEAIALGLHHVVAQAVGRMAIHQTLAGDDAHAAVRGGFEQRVDRSLVYRREHHRAGRAVREQRIEKSMRTRRRHLRVGIGAFGRERVGVEPVEQLGAIARDHVELRAVHMRVDEARQNEPAAMIGAGPRRIGVLFCGLRALDAAAFDEQPVVGSPAHACLPGVSKPRRGGEIEQVAAQREPCRLRGATRHHFSGSIALRATRDA